MNASALSSKETSSICPTLVHMFSWSKRSIPLARKLLLLPIEWVGREPLVGLLHASLDEARHRAGERAFDWPSLFLYLLYLLFIARLQRACMRIAPSIRQL